MKTRYLYVFGIVLGLADLVTVNLAFVLAYSLLDNPQAWVGTYYHCLIISNVFWFLSSLLFGVYGDKLTRGVELMYRATFRSLLLHIVLFVFYLTFAKEMGVSRSFILMFYLFAGTGFFFTRFAGAFVEMFLRKRVQIRKSVAVLGMNSMGLRLASFFEKRKSSFAFEGFLDEKDGLYIDKNGEILPSTVEQIRTASEKGIKEVYVSVTPDRMNDIGRLLRVAEKECVRLKLVPDFTNSLIAPFTLSHMDEFPVISLRKEPLEEIQNRFKKRLVDIAVSSMVILFILSWMYPLFALIIKLQSPGPVFYKQLRSTRNNKHFVCYKFRSMRIHKEEGPTRLATQNDSRVTPFGKFLRKTSLDEFPQFFNVFLGDMSIVGPRPHPLSETEKYSSIINQFMVRHFLKAGITGWAQVNGCRGNTDAPGLMEKRVEHDIWYLENWSSMLDIKIVFMTIINMLKGEKNAY